MAASVLSSTARAKNQEKHAPPSIVSLFSMSRFAGLLVLNARAPSWHERIDTFSLRNAFPLIAAMLAHLWPTQTHRCRWFHGILLEPPWPCHHAPFDEADMAAHNILSARNVCIESNEKNVHASNEPEPKAVHRLPGSSGRGDTPQHQTRLGCEQLLK